MNNLEQVFLNLIIISSFLTTALLGLGAIFKISEISHKRILNLGIFLNLLAVCFTAYFYIFNHFRPFETQPL
ncbi:MAG: hypothetical protein ABIQ95_14295, partial [Bdellovibrionia bacterium]